MWESTKAWLMSSPNIPELEGLLEIIHFYALILLKKKLRLRQGK